MDLDNNNDNIFNTGPVKNLPPGLHNFVIVVAFIWVFVWAWRYVRRFRRVQELYHAVLNKNVVRIDSLSNHVRSAAAVTREHVRQLLITRSVYTTSYAERKILTCQFHVDNFKLVATPEDENVWYLVSTITCASACAINVIYGLRESSVRKMHSQRNDQTDGNVRKRRRSKPRKDSLSRGFPPNSWMQCSEALPLSSGSNQEVRLAVDPDMLAQCCSARMASVSFPLTVHLYPVTPDDNNTWDTNEQSLLVMLDFSNSEANGSELPSVRIRKQMVVSPKELLELKLIYGIEDASTRECTVCLTEIKDIVPLPCRHCCVCRSCLDHIQAKCPVCRSQISSFLQFDFTQQRPVVMPTATDTGEGLDEEAVQPQL